MHTNATTPTVDKGLVERKGRPLGFWFRTTAGDFAACTRLGDFRALTLSALVSILEHAARAEEAKEKAHQRAKNARQEKNSEGGEATRVHDSGTRLNAFSVLVFAFVLAMLTARQQMIFQQVFRYEPRRRYSI